MSDTVSNRTELTALMAYARMGDTVVVHSMDRLARNLDDLRRIVHFLTERGGQITFVKEQLTFIGEDSPMAQFLLSVMGAYRGRKRALSDAEIAAIKAQIASGKPKAYVARDFGISRETLYQYLRLQE